MKLTKYQKARLQEFEWDIVECDVKGKEQNCQWLQLDAEDGVVYSEVCDLFGLSGGSAIRLLVVGTQEDEVED